MQILTDLQKAQIKFDQDTAKLIVFAQSKGILCFTHEKGILRGRTLIVDGRRVKGLDGVHLGQGNHYRFLAFDLIVLRADGSRITSGSDPVWKILGEYWETLDPQNNNGRSWGDANHFSRIWGGFK